MVKQGKSQVKLIENMRNLLQVTGQEGVFNQKITQNYW